MAGEFAHITRCMDLRERDIAQAVRTRDATRGLLSHLAAISAPSSGAAKVLLVLSRMATTACDWIDGELCVEAFSHSDCTVIEVTTELGGGLRERLFPTLSFRAPITEFARAMTRAAHLIAPLVIRTQSARRISLSANEAARRTTAPPPPVEISSESLFLRAASPQAAHEESSDEKLPLVPQPYDLDRGWER